MIAYTCKEQQAATTDIRLLTLRPVLNNQFLSFKAGQYIHYPLSTGESIALSIANAPREDGVLTFHLRHGPDHRLSEQCLAEITQSSQILLGPAQGKCTLDRLPFSVKRVLFLAGGTGFSPLQALLEEALKEKRFTSLHLYWGIRRSEDAYAEKQLADWQAAFPFFHFTFVLSEPRLFPTWHGATGWVHEKLASDFPDLSQEWIFASGPFPMIQAAKQLNADHLFSDML